MVSCKQIEEHENECSKKKQEDTVVKNPTTHHLKSHSLSQAPLNSDLAQQSAETEKYNFSNNTPVKCRPVERDYHQSEKKHESAAFQMRGFQRTNHVMRSGHNMLRKDNAYAGASLGFGKNPNLHENRRASGLIGNSAMRPRNQSSTVLLRSQNNNRLTK